jgi:hypothetical protein
VGKPEGQRIIIRECDSRFQLKVECRLGKLETAVNVIGPQACYCLDSEWNLRIDFGKGHGTAGTKNPAKTSQVFHGPNVLDCLDEVKLYSSFGFST